MNLMIHTIHRSVMKRVTLLLHKRDESSYEEEERGSSPSGSSSTWGPCKEFVQKHRFSGGSGLGVQLNITDLVYAGKSETPKGKRVGHGHEVVLQLTTGLLNKGRTLYIDNFYTSVGLAEELLENKMYDKRLKLMISSNPELAENVVTSTSKNKKGEIVIIPKSVLAYNKAKKGVDVSDQMSLYYTCIRRTLKWYKKLAIELLLGSCMKKQKKVSQGLYESIRNEKGPKEASTNVKIAKVDQ
ncbi:hypothetical protein J437_LFUL007934 [Ladona fulva]|uniref:PiggyBac transposable element-derived protein domain-containing protein n=1 Tax=Ladona fulva TaxID=123851 RepID=A0A8K0K9T2_LADFU|nr:hypothetical protein J437_LFUL007934 [Ladona fulva]